METWQRHCSGHALELKQIAGVIEDRRTCVVVRSMEIMLRQGAVIVEVLGLLPKMELKL